MNMNPFVKGQTVRAIFSKKLATVVGIPEAAGEGLVEVRFDGDTGSVRLHFSRFEAIDVKHIDTSNAYNPYLFRKGDFIRVLDKGKAVYEGTAMTDIQDIGSALFQMLTKDGKLLDFNCNYVEVTNLFRADVARGDMPKF
jgi:hypothetical protein